jgi:hypothetical protein
MTQLTRRVPSDLSTDGEALIVLKGWRWSVEWLINLGGIMSVMQVIRLLCKIGEFKAIDDATLKAKLQSLPGTNWIHGSSSGMSVGSVSWTKIASKLSITEHANLTIGLGIADNWADGGGASVAGAIWSYMKLFDRDQYAAYEVAKWLSEHVKNEYILNRLHLWDPSDR